MTRFSRLLRALCVVLASGSMHAWAAVAPVEEILSVSPEGKTRIVAKFIPAADDPEHLVLEGLYVEVERKQTRISGNVSEMVGMSQNRFHWDVHWAPDGSSVAIDACHKHLSRVDVLLREGNRYRLLEELVKFGLKKEVLAWMKIHRPGIPLSEDKMGKTWISFGDYTKGGMRLEFSINPRNDCSGTSPGYDGNIEIRFATSPTMETLPTVKVSDVKLVEDS
jgi:hypothetical protein